MKVDSIQQKYYAYPNNQRKMYSPTFQKAPQNVTDKIIDALPGKKILRFMEEKLSWMKGEIGGVAMTAIGTGLVAPWPIAFNPFVKAPKNASEEEKQDVKNTKVYTALRQPISAVLAAIFQIAALQPIDKFLDYLYNTPNFAKSFDIDTNQSVLNNKNFIKRQIMKQMKEEGNTKASLGKEAYDEMLKERIAKTESEQIDDLAKKIAQTHKIQVGEKFIDDHKVANIVNEQIDSYINVAKDLRIDNKGLSYYSERAKILIENEGRLRELFTQLPTGEKELETHLKDLISREQNADVKLLLEEILDRKPEIRANRAERTLWRIDKIKELCNGQYSFDNYMDAMAKRNAELDKIITKLDMTKIKNLEGATPEVIEKAIKETAEICHFKDHEKLLKSILHDTKAFDTYKESLTKKIYKDVAKGYKKFVANSYKSHNQIWKIAIGVFITLPITCNVLNWVYPRFMELAFPRLAGSKAKQVQKEKEGN